MRSPSGRAGFDVTLLNRGSSSTRPVPDGARVLTADVRDRAAVAEALARKEFDVVMRVPGVHARAGRRPTSSCSAAGPGSTSSSARPRPTRSRPPGCRSLESTPLRNPFWQYSRDKIACEDLLVAAYREDGFPATIVRPSHTYDRTLAAARRRVDGDRPDAPRRAGRRARRRHVAVDADPPHRLRAGVRRAAGQPARDRRGFHITSDEALHLGRDHPAPGRRRRRRAAHRARALGRDRRGRPGAGARACSATRPTRWSSTTRRSRRPSRAARPRSRSPQGAREIIDLVRRGPGTAGVVDAGWTR